MATSVKSKLPILTLLLLTGCLDQDIQAYRRAYESSCREAATAHFEDLNVKSTCNGLPGLHAVAISPLPLIRNDAARVVQFAVDHLHLNVDQAAPGSGLTATMMAVEAKNETLARELVLRTDPRRQDARGRNLLHFLAEAKLQNYDHLLIGWDNLYDLLIQKSSGAPSAIEVARANHNLPFLWQAITLTRRPDLLRGADVSYFFHPAVENELDLLDSFGSTSRASFSGFVDGTSVNDYALLHYAAEHLLPELVHYLLSRGVDSDVVSSRGSPLALALNRARGQLSSSDQARMIATVRILMANPVARQARDVPAALMGAGRLDWLEGFLIDGRTLGSYQDLQFRGPANNSPFQEALMRCYPATKTCDKQAIRATLKFGLQAPPNSAGQNAAHTFYALVPYEDYHGLAGGTISEGFRWFTLSAAAQGLLDQDDALRMRPIHHWLASAARKPGRELFAEMTRLRLLLLETHDVTTLTISHDSVVSLAVMSGNPNLVRMLLEARADVRPLINMPNLLGRSPRKLAHDSPDKEMQHVFDGYP